MAVFLSLHNDQMVKTVRVHNYYVILFLRIKCRSGRYKEYGSSLLMLMFTSFFIPVALFNCKWNLT